MTYRERRARKAERLQEWAAKREDKAAALLKQNEPYHGDIAFNTQPGHIPERARAIARSDRAFEHANKADAMRSRAAGIADQLDASIYSDDHDALERLQERIAELEAQRERIKAYNASCRKGTRNVALLDDSQQAELVTALRFQPYACKDGAFPGYALSNLSGNIKRNRDRLEQSKRRAAVTAQAEESPNGVAIIGEDFVNIIFAEKPDRAILDALKTAGFHYGGGSWGGYRAHIPAEVLSLATS